MDGPLSPAGTQELSLDSDADMGSGDEQLVFDRDLQPGDMVGKFRIEEKIGEGGFGTVYRAINDIEKVGAIKVLRLQYSANPEMVSRFKEEARAVNKIRHRNIIDIFEFGKLGDGRQFYVMEYLAGMPLDDYLDDVHHLELGSAIAILRGVARALDAAHAKGIAHRDLKPENIFLVDDEELGLSPKLLDFGIAKLLTNQSAQKHKTRTGAPLGTPYYMSPEQARGRDVDHRTDVYAFGCVMYRMLTGQYAFDGEDYMEILVQQISEQAPPPSSIIAELPAGVDEAIGWMMQKDPAQRPPNLVTAIRSLEEAAQRAGIVVPSRPTSGAYAAPTNPLAAQSTPSFTPSSVSGRMETAETVAQTPSGISGIGDAAPRRSGLILFGALGAAVVAGVAAYAILSASSAEDENSAAGDTAVAAATEQAAQTPDPAREEPPPPPPKQTPPEPEKPALVTVDITAAPPGTEVYGPHGLLGVAPGKIQLGTGSSAVTLTFKAEGYNVGTREVVPDKDIELELSLDKKKAKKTPRRSSKKSGTSKKGTKKSGRNSIEDPFD